MPTALEHECIDCRTEVAESGDSKRHPRKCVDRPGTKRCTTHDRAFTRHQRKQARARSIERTYDISAEDAHELLLLQGGRCWLCLKATGATKSLAVDHDHATGEVRGRLCGPCNQFIGRLGDDPAAAQRLTGYLSGDTPYRRLRAKQTLDAADPKHPADVTVERVFNDERSGGLGAEWRHTNDCVPSLAFVTLVRSASGVWAVPRWLPGQDSEPRVETVAECSSCHALPDQPHTEYCDTALLASDCWPGHDR